MFAQVEDFLKDDDFIHYVLGVTPEAASRWALYFDEHPEHKRVAEEAKAVLLAPADVRCDCSVDDSRSLKEWIFNTIDKIS